MVFYEKIVPFEGTETFKLYQQINDVKTTLAALNISYKEEIWQSDSETIKNPWNVIIVDETISFFFASNGKLFKIVFWNNYKGKLFEKISTGMQVKDAKSIDKTLEYSDWNEDYESQLGYWLEDDIETGKIISITVFIKEILDEENFDRCEW